MSKFTEIIPERGLQEAADAGDVEATRLLKNKLSSGQKDVMEGAIADLDLDALTFLEDDKMKEIVIGDPKARALGYSYCNIVCFNKIGYSKIYDKSSFKPPMSEPRIIAYDVENPTPMSEGFGDYAVIILDMREFLNRVKSVVVKKGWKFLAGSVNYHPLKLGNKRITRVNGDTTLTLIMEPAIDLQELLKQKEYVINERDAFDKWDIHAIEKEYRIALERNDKLTDAVRIEIGDISDIAVAVKAKEVRRMIDNLLLSGKIGLSEEDYFGNISRIQMRHEFYEMGNGKVNIMLVVGGIAEYEED